MVWYTGNLWALFFAYMILVTAILIPASIIKAVKQEQLSGEDLTDDQAAIWAAITGLLWISIVGAGLAIWIVLTALGKQGHWLHG